MSTGEYKPDLLVVLQHTTVVYIDAFLTKEESKTLFDWCIRNLDFGQHKIKFMGKEIDQPRKTCAVGIENYSYSGLTLKGTPMPDCFIPIIDKLMTFLPETHPRPNVVLCNYYEDGTRYIAAHSDNETFLVPGSSICGLSLGAKRRFDIIPKSKDEKKCSIYLEDGSMVIMGNGMQQHYKHTVPKQLKMKDPRINLTFRVSKS